MSDKIKELHDERRRCEKRIIAIDKEIVELRKAEGRHFITTALRDGAWAQAIYAHSRYDLPMGADTFTKIARAGYHKAKAWRIYNEVTIQHGWRHDTQSSDDWLGDTYASPELYGYTITAVTRGEDEIIFTRSDGAEVIMGWWGFATYHVQIDSIEGDFDLILNAPLEAMMHTFRDDEDDEKIWTVYRLSAAGHTVVIAWFETDWEADLTSSVCTRIKE